MSARAMAWVKAALLRPGVAVFALVFAGYAYFYQAGGWNQNSRFDLTRAIVERGTLRIDRYAKNTGDASRRAGHMYCDKAPGVSLLAVPAWAAVHAIAPEPPPPAALATGAWLAAVTAVGVPSALGVVMMFLLAASLGLARSRAALVALAWGLATLAFPYATLLYGHQLLAAMLVAAFALLVRARGPATAQPEPPYNDAPHTVLGVRRADGARTRTLVAVGALLGGAVAVEYTAALAAVPIAAYALVVAPWRRAVVAIGAGALGPAIVVAAYHTAAFGGPFTLPYEFSTQQHRHLGWFMGLGTPDLGVLGKITFSAYRGLFYAAPWLLLAVPGAVRWWAHGRRGEVGVCVAVIVLFLWLNASLVDWQGGWTMGPRYLIPAIPFLVVLAAGVILPAPGGSRLARVLADRRARVAAAVALAVVVAGSAVVMLAGTAVRPEVDVHVRRPLAFVLDHFARGELGISTQSIDMITGNPHGPPQAWNLGHRIGLTGHASLVPLLAVWAACAAWLGIALRRAPRHEAVASDNS